MKTETATTHIIRLYLSGPIEIAKQAIRAETLRAGLCVTIEPTTFIYTGGEEIGYVVGLVNYPRFPVTPDALVTRARALMDVKICLIDCINETPAVKQSDSWAGYVDRQGGSFDDSETINSTSWR